MKKSRITILLTLTVIITLQIFINTAIAENKIILDYFYSSNCGSCEEKLVVIEEGFENNESYNEILTITKKDIVVNEQYMQEWMDIYDYNPYPFVVIISGENKTIIDEFDITVENIENVISTYLTGDKPNETKDENVINTPFGKINISGLSLPILTIVLGGMDSFNPCAFFILIFLLNLLLYAKSRRRMLIIGGVFIFFSGLLYMLFMFILFETFLLTRDYVRLITIIAGSVALVLGIINIKDFFFFKKGASLSIPEDKKPGIYKQMRKLVKNPKITASIIGTIILAGTVNFYELLCTLGLPLVFTQRLALYNLTMVEYYTFILFYNIVYVIPLIIIVLIFVITLGRRKLTEWHGQIMKLVSGIMLISFGSIFLINYKILENIITPILLLMFSLVATFIISKIWIKVKKLDTENLTKSNTKK
jgi:hypothetical protein